MTLAHRIRGRFLSYPDFVPAAGLRKFPYPYQAALAFSFDAELLSLEVMEELLRFLNTCDATRLGRGIGLEATCSLFFHSPAGTTVSWFGPAGRRSPQATRIAEYLKTGFLDANHAFGDFDARPAFRRELALATYEVLAGLGVTLPIFTNHGTSANVQNVGGDAPYQRGDVPGEAAYHSDLFPGNGVRYIWTDSAVFSPPAGLREGVRRLLRPESPRLLLEPVRLRDGTMMLRFRRFRSIGREAPNCSLLGRQVEELNLPRLLAEGKTAVLYQHPGVLRKEGNTCVPATVEALRTLERTFLSPLRRIAGYHDEGRLWVRGLARVLGYVELAQGCAVRKEGRRLVIAPPRKLEHVPRDLEGLTIYCDEEEGMVVSCQGIDLTVVHNPPDETARRSVSVPLSRAAGPW